MSRRKGRMKKLITKIKHWLIHKLCGAISLLDDKPSLVSTETVMLSVIKAEQRLSAEYYHQLVKVTPNIALNREIENALAVNIGKEIIKRCGFYKRFDDITNEHVYSVSVEVTGRCLLKGEEICKNIHQKK